VKGNESDRIGLNVSTCPLGQYDHFCLGAGLEAKRTEWIPGSAALLLIDGQLLRSFGMEDFDGRTGGVTNRATDLIDPSHGDFVATRPRDGYSKHDASV